MVRFLDGDETRADREDEYSWSIQDTSFPQVETGEVCKLTSLVRCDAEPVNLRHRQAGGFALAKYLHVLGIPLQLGGGPEASPSQMVLTDGANK